MAPKRQALAVAQGQYDEVAGALKIKQVCKLANSQTSHLAFVLPSTCVCVLSAMLGTCNLIWGARLRVAACDAPGNMCVCHCGHNACLLVECACSDTHLPG